MTDIQIPIARPTAAGEHKHCEICGRSIALDGRVCSDTCKARLLEAHRMKKRSVWMFIGVIALTLIFALYGSQIFRIL